MGPIGEIIFFIFFFFRDIGDMKKRVSVLVIELSSMNSTEKANININTSFILWKKQPLQKKKKKS